MTFNGNKVYFLAFGIFFQVMANNFLIFYQECYKKLLQKLRKNGLIGLYDC